MAAPNVSFYVHRDFQAAPTILEMLIVLIAYIHIISCMWFALGTFPASNQNTWARAINLDQEPIAHKFTMSFHFIWTCLINASHDVLLLNTFERVCTLFVWISWGSSFFRCFWVQWHRIFFNSKIIRKKSQNSSKNTSNMCQTYIKYQYILGWLIVLRWLSVIML